MGATWRNVARTGRCQRTIRRSLLLEIETSDGTVGMATGSGGIAACSIIEHGVAGLLIGADARDIARLWDQMYRATLPYGR